MKNNKNNKPNVKAESGRPITIKVDTSRLIEITKGLTPALLSVLFLATLSSGKSYIEEATGYAPDVISLFAYFVSAVLSFSLGKVFARSRRMALSSNVLLIIFLASTQFTAAAFVRITGIGDDYAPLSYMIYVTPFALALHWFCFRLPLAMAACITLCTAIIYLTVFFRLPEAVGRLNDAGWFSSFGLMFLIVGLPALALVVWLDIKGQHDLSSKSDIAFWLYIGVAFLLPPPNLVPLAVSNNATASLFPLVILAIPYLLITLFSLYMNRRIFIFSTLIFLGYAIQNTDGTMEKNPELWRNIIILFGGILLITWDKLRQQAMRVCPDRIRSFLPPTR